MIKLLCVGLNVVFTLSIRCIISFIVNPFIVTEPQSQLVVNDSTVSFTCTAIAFPAPVYNWSTPIPNTDFNTGTITILVDYSYFGNYTCFAESNGTIAESLPALLTGNLHNLVLMLVFLLHSSCYAYCTPLYVRTFKC